MPRERCSKVCVCVSQSRSRVNRQLRDALILAKVAESLELM